VQRPIFGPHLQSSFSNVLSCLQPTFSSTSGKIVRHSSYWHPSINARFQASAAKQMRTWPLKIGPIGYPETSLRKYHHSPRNDPEKRSSHPSIHLYVFLRVFGFRNIYTLLFDNTTIVHHCYVASPLYSLQESYYITGSKRMISTLRFTYLDTNPT